MSVDLATIAQQGIAALMLVTFITMLIRGDVVLGREYKSALEDRDFWRDAAQRGLDLTETAIEPATQRRDHERH